jgi:beta-glucanase (GH16 family)
MVVTNNKKLTIYIIKKEEDAKGDKRYWSGEIFSQSKFKFGTYEVKMKPVFVPGLITSFFLYGSNADEIDIAEFVGNDSSKVEVTHYIQGEKINHTPLSLPESGDGFYTITLEWTPDFLEWSINGEKKYKTTKNVPQAPMYIMCNFWPVNRDLSDLVNWAGNFEYPGKSLGAEYSHIRVALGEHGVAYS